MPDVASKWAISTKGLQFSWGGGASITTKVRPPPSHRKYRLKLASLLAAVNVAGGTTPQS